MLVSVIIPCYNVESYIEECLASVYAQTHTELEVICVDNNSSDATVNILNRLRLDKYPGLVLTGESKKGASAARNKGLEMAQGEWIQFLDADDLLKQDKISHQLGHPDINDNVGFIVGKSIKLDKHGNEIYAGSINHNQFIAPFINQSGNTCANLWNTAHLRSAGGWNHEIASSQETDLMLRMIISGSQCIYDEAENTIIRERESGQISQSDPVRRWSQFLTTRINYLQELSVKHPEIFRKEKQVYLSYLLSTIMILAKHDRDAALRFYNACNMSEWEPQNIFGIKRMHGNFIKYFGFRTYSQLKQLLGR